MNIHATIYSLDSFCCDLRAWILFVSHVFRERRLRR
jgi:hypothetical protein